MKSQLLLVIMILLSCFKSEAQNTCVPIITNGLVAYYPFCNNANDASGGSGNNGILTGTSFVNDRFGNSASACSLNGISDYITLPSGSATSLNVTGNFSVCFWLKTSQGSNHIISFGDVINANGGGYLAGLNDGSAPVGKLGYSIQGIWHNSTNILNDNSWHNIAITLKVDTLRLYIDGVLDIQNINVLPPLSWSGNRVIGARNDNHSLPYQGILDDISVYNRALTYSEITQLHTTNICYKTITVTDTLIINANLTSFNPVTFMHTIKIYPNPTNDQITINYGNYTSLSGYTLKIMNSLSQIVFTTSITQQTSSVNLSSWTGNGVYFVHLIDSQSNTIEIRKIVLQ